MKLTKKRSSSHVKAGGFLSQSFLWALGIALAISGGCGQSTQQESTQQESTSTDNRPVQEKNAASQPETQTTPLADFIKGKRIHFRTPGGSETFWSDFDNDGTHRHSHRGTGKFKVQGLKVSVVDFEQVELVFPKAKVTTGDTFQTKTADGNHVLLFEIVEIEPKPKKLTPTQAIEVMAWDIGKWKTRGKGMPVDGDPQTIEMTKTVRWKEKGKSLEYQFDLLENGQPVTYYGHQEFDAAKGIFIYRSKWGDNPETTAHIHYDPATQTSFSQPSPSNPPSETKTVTVTERLGENQTRQKLEVFFQDQRVYSHQLVSTRMDPNPKGTPPEPKTKSGSKNPR